MKIFNTLGRKKEEFVPLVDGKVGIYSCGPTVYNFAHIGNLSTFIFADLLKRFLIYLGLDVFHVMNLTDVDDKTIKGSKKEGLSLRDFTEKYAETFFRDLKILNIMPADVFPKATEHIPEMVDMIKRLLANGSAYEKDGSIYFRISSFPSYGDLALLDRRELKTGASGVDMDEYSKEDVRDFVLWKAYKPEEDGDVFWETEIGKGRPGWHIECSAMSMKYLGETFDIHTGAVDLIFPHHQNEIAQSEGATGKQFVKYWVHRDHLRMGEDKMSKSLGNFKVLSDVVKSPMDAAAFRYMVVSSHYRSPLLFTDETFASAKNTVRRLLDLKTDLAGIKKGGYNTEGAFIAEVRQRFAEEMQDDLNSPRAMAEVFRLVNDIEPKIKKGDLSQKSALAVIDFLNEIDEVLGVFKIAMAIQRNLSAEEEGLILEREQARKDKNWKRADEIRNLLKHRGILIEDSADGSKIVFE